MIGFSQNPESCALEDLCISTFHCILVGSSLQLAQQAGVKLKGDVS